MRITPSILSADVANLGRDVDRIADADGIHIDVMDYHFVPNLSFGLPVVESLRRHTEQFIDVHLMVEDPSKWALGYAEAGADSVTFHVEAASSPIRLARDLRRKGTRASIALNPMTPIWTYEPLLSEVDMVLLMTVEPGYGGQAFLEFVLPKIRKTRQLLGDRDVWIQVDGGISRSTIEQCAEAGADTFVAGSAVFSAEDPNSMVKYLRELAISGSRKTPRGITID